MTRDRQARRFSAPMRGVVSLRPVGQSSRLASKGRHRLAVQGVNTARGPWQRARCTSGSSLGHGNARPRFAASRQIGPAPTMSRAQRRRRPGQGSSCESNTTPGSRRDHAGQQGSRAYRPRDIEFTYPDTPRVENKILVQRAPVAMTDVAVSHPRYRPHPSDVPDTRLTVGSLEKVPPGANLDKRPQVWSPRHSPVSKRSGPPNSLTNPRFVTE